MKKLETFIYTLLWIGVMVVIFLFSLQDGDASSAVSGSIAEWLKRLIPFDCGGRVEAIIRKCAHLFLYTCLGITGTLAVRSWFRRLKDLLPERSMFRREVFVWAAALMQGFLYACTDEWHQTFVAGRNGSFYDVLIDTAGVAAGVLLIYCFHFRALRKRIFPSPAAKDT